MLIFVALIVILLGALWLTEWKPKEVEVIEHNTPPLPVSMGDTITIVSWNIGYAGLGSEMDFFYDGGTRARTTSKLTQENLDGILAFVRSYCGVADFFLLQEVDFDSKRSYHTNQYEAFKAVLQGYHGTYAYNYVSPFVPIPMSDPIGRVKSGMATFSRYNIVQATRYQYPSSFAFPVSLFNLKRGMLEVAILLENGDTLYVNNTHNTAFDTGTMRAEEFAFMSDHLSGKSLSFTGGDFNSNPPGYVASQEELDNKFFSPISVSADDFPANMTFAYDPAVPTMRYNYEPYRQGITTTSIVDFGLLGSGFELVDTRTIDLGFANSDHNPVVYKIVFRRTLCQDK